MPDIKVVDAEKEELKVQYCIPVWLRDEQIQLNSARYPDRIQPGELKDEPIALACFGPSLNDTWEELKKFDQVISCSGSHKFLMDHGVIPTMHVEVDPRDHKIDLIGDKISPDTTFFMASCCHPAVFDHLESHNAKITLWHTYSGEPHENVPHIFPRGEWLLTGGANVGLRALVIARFLGYRDIHIFGMDGSFKDEMHAASHPNQNKKGQFWAEYGDEKYLTTQSFLNCARETFHEISMLPDVNLHFYGTGLIQAMAKDKLSKEGIKRKNSSKIAFLHPPTISPEYCEQNRQLHTTNSYYGISSLRHIKTIRSIYKKIEASSLLDYGCGRGLLAKNLDFPIWEYDPAIPDKATPPRQADLVVCIDVLEHVEPEYLEATLYDVARCTNKIAYFTIATGKSGKHLPDGRNTHILCRNRDWWIGELSKYFVLTPRSVFGGKKGELRIVAGRKPDRKVKEINVNQEKAG